MGRVDSVKFLFGIWGIAHEHSVAELKSFYIIKRKGKGPAAGCRNGRE